MSYVLALDQGTTSSRAIIFDRRLRACAQSQTEFAQHFPRPGWVEHDPSDLWETQFATAREAIRTAGITGKDIAGIGITNQRETVLIWDRATGTPIHNALVWQDRRTAELCEHHKERGLETLVQSRTGLLLDPYFSASKIRWLLDHCDGALAAARAGRLACGTVDSWLVWQLTNGTQHVIDASNASRTMLLNIHSGQWDDDLLALWDIPRALLPRVVDSCGPIATTRAFGEHPIPITGIAGDQHAALFGQACWSAGAAKCTYGTGCFILMHTGATVIPSQSRLLSTIAWSIDGQREYALEGSVFVGGALIQWLRDGLGIIDKAAAIEALAASVPSSEGLVIVPAFTGLGAPYWDPNARGLMIGLTRGTNTGHIARAALESIALQVGDVIDAMHRDGANNVARLRVDGGASANDLLMQIQSDVLNIPLARPPQLEVTAIGAAALAGLGAKLWPSRSALAPLSETTGAFSPQADRARIETLITTWHAAVKRAGAWALSGREP